MANTGIYHGSDALVYIETGVDTWTAVGHTTSHAIQVTSEMVVRRTKDTGKFPTRKVTGLDYNVSIEALVLYDGYSLKDLLTLQLAGTQLKFKLAGHSNEDWGVQEDVGDWYLEGYGKISDSSMNMAANEDGSYSVKLDADGDLSIETVPAV